MIWDDSYYVWRCVIWVFVSRIIHSVKFRAPSALAVDNKATYADAFKIVLVRVAGTERASHQHITNISSSCDWTSHLAEKLMAARSVATELTEIAKPTSQHTRNETKNERSKSSSTIFRRWESRTKKKRKTKVFLSAISGTNLDCETDERVRCGEKKDE